MAKKSSKEDAVVDAATFDPEDVKNFKDVANMYIGQKAAVLCARYQYRGIISMVLEECLVISDACAVEVSGSTASPQPQTEDPISGPVIIKCDSIELLYQPNWCFAPLPSEDNYPAGGDNN